MRSAYRLPPRTRRTLVRALTLAYAVSGAAASGAESPDALLATLSAEDRAWVEAACPGAQGPQLRAACVARQVRALSGVHPDLASLSRAERDWILDACPRADGPAFHLACVAHEMEALRAGVPKTDDLPAEARQWIERACPRSLGPSHYGACVEREARAARRRDVLDERRAGERGRGRQSADSEKGRPAPPARTASRDARWSPAECDPAARRCDEACATARIFDHAAGAYVDSDFERVCQEACGVGRAACGRTRAPDTRCWVFRRGCERACPTRAFYGLDGREAAATDVEEECRQACSAGESACQ